ncbi:hypothetical protein [Streptomyces mobaraensis]|uniref:Uncharacterized protein n=1 Tax=Streptomyces mobaraensis TaxID=35621 RepID=A0A5N5WCU3_STRMB|nr:hypothetical protein [Streptomyces mobaraensis]KAB7849229.1 hypothetical protein FRZ00_07335 [Streptomyces mobaraensis]
MTSDIESAAQQAAVFMAGKRKADETAFMLAQLAMMGVRVGDRRSWPQLAGRASLSGEPSVYLGAVPMDTAKQLIGALIYAESAKRFRWRVAPAVGDEVSGSARRGESP